jgi:hypothetical protein
MRTDDVDTLEQLIEDARAELESSKPGKHQADALVAAGRWVSAQRRRLSWLRRVMLGGLSAYGLVAALLFSETLAWLDTFANPRNAAQIRSTLFGEFGLAVMLPVGVGFVAYLLARRWDLAAQLTSRALLWSLAMAIAALEWVYMSAVLSTPDASVGDGVRVMIVAASSLGLIGSATSLSGLWILGDHGLRGSRPGPFRPAAFEGLLTLSLVMGVADAVLLAVVAWMGPTLSVPALLLAVWLIASAWALFRLRTWGLAAMALGNLAEVGFAASGLLDVPFQFIAMFLATAAVQVLLPVPVYGAMIRGRVVGTAFPAWVHKVPYGVMAVVGALAVAQWGVILLRI